MVRDYLGTLCLRCNRNDFTALTFVKSTCCRTQATSLQGLIPDHHSNTNKKCPNWDIFHWWRMVRDSNPRTSCPVSGFQDRRIRPLCQPSGTYSNHSLYFTGEKVKLFLCKFFYGLTMLCFSILVYEHSI